MAEVTFQRSRTPAVLKAAVSVKVKRAAEAAWAVSAKALAACPAAMARRNRLIAPGTARPHHTHLRRHLRWGGSGP